MILTINPNQIAGFTDYEAARLNKLLILYNNHAIKNETKNKYYEGKISLNDVNLGIALPDGLQRLG